jgi:hypothetical protein
MIKDKIEVCLLIVTVRMSIATRTQTLNSVRIKTAKMSRTAKGKTPMKRKMRRFNVQTNSNRRMILMISRKMLPSPKTSHKTSSNKNKMLTRPVK